MSEDIKRGLAQLQEDAQYLSKHDPENANMYSIIWDECADMILYGKPQTTNLFNQLS